MLAVAEAIARVVAAASGRPPRRAPVPIAEALGAALASDLVAAIDLPPFANSQMDGWAVRAADTPGSLPVAGESRAGGPTPAALAPGTAQRIFTGAPLPHGADAVVMQEEVRRAGDRVTVQRAIPVGEFIRARGNDVRSGSRVLAAGTTIGPGEIGMLAALGYAAVEIAARPRVAVVPTGDEIVEVGEGLRPGAIYDSNRYVIEALVRGAGATAVPAGIAPDDPTILRARLEQALAADVVVTIGGVSVGEHDRVKECLESLGVALDFWKVAMRPGKPIAFGRRGETYVVGLPGNPVSAMVTFELFARPLLLRLGGHARIYRPVVRARTDRAYEKAAGRTEFARGILEETATGRVVRLLTQQGSGMHSSMIGIDALAVLPALADSIPAGAAVPVFCLTAAAVAEPPSLDA